MVELLMEVLTKAGKSSVRAILFQGQAPSDSYGC
jgi:hypothetical protein